MTVGHKPNHPDLDSSGALYILWSDTRGATTGWWWQYLNLILHLHYHFPKSCWVAGNTPKMLLQPAWTPRHTLPTSWRIYIHITSRLTPQPPLPHAPPEHIPSLVGGVFHVLAEGSPQWRFYRHIPTSVQQLHIPAGKKKRDLRFWRVSSPCGQAFAPSCLMQRVCLT